ncbi:phosphonate ABC transporter ATP-binding protein [Rhodovibrio salinarum]|uniref:Phosphonate ABC transporter ATP-binding protein n=1 Tax=Rhodovibrio salinarum TaxID=1087 RepID=A0A934QKQ8_9PROT|nr:phosphonate ABC transporter ATP-binding protein [Rhodovibrio salinarum]MBK1698507.1 phosphonate ABC transporter ATP-binding protein [Rhodovibrio salinarum]
MLQVDNLTKTYPTGQKALDACSLKVEKSQVVAVIGPSGAGKSSFIRCINRLVEPSEGQIWLDGTEVTALNSDQMAKMRRHMGMIFQEYNLVERLTVMENVLSGRLGFVSFWQAFFRKFPQADIDRAFELLERVGLAGYENNRADALSGGQRQRVGIARALIQEPKILLVDEPTSSLDPKTARTILALIADLARERGLPALINIHDVGLALMFAERVVGLSQGKIVFDGGPEQVDEHILTRIFGEADWRQTIRHAAEDAEALEASRTAETDGAADDDPQTAPPASQHGAAG